LLKLKISHSITNNIFQGFSILKADLMKNLTRIKKLALIVCLLLLAGGAVSCSSTTDSRLNVWIDFPHDGAAVPVGVPVVVISHAYAREGISEAMLYVDSAPYRRETPSEANAEFSEFRHEWMPPGPGDYALQVWVYDTAGETGGPATVFVHVGDPIVVEFVDTSTPTLVPPSTFTPTPTRLPSVTSPPATYTPTPIPPTYTPTPVPPPPEDNTPPPVPSPVVPADGLVLSCRLSQVLNWQPVQDPSGIAGYYVKLEWEQTAGNWVTEAGYGPIGDKQIEVSVDCGVRYRWRVRAEDGEGNVSDWSTPYHFSINLN
jgi:hypothetical protein